MASLLKQERLHDALADAPMWAADLDAGTLTVGARTYPADVIGTGSIATETFVSGWANPTTHSTRPPHRCGASARSARSAGPR